MRQFIAKVLAMFLLFFFSLSIFSVSANCDDDFIPRGINLAGLEFAKKEVPGLYDKDYFSISDDIFAYYAGVGFNSVRIPFLWERLQPNLFGPLSSDYLGYLEDILLRAQKYGMYVVLDLHNYGRYGEGILGDEISPDSLADLWLKVDKALSAMHSIYAYGIMNEPHDMDGRWEEIITFVVKRLRAAGVTTHLYISGDGWSSTYNWSKLHPSKFVDDVFKNYSYEGHLYLDGDSSGRYRSLDYIPPELILKRLSTRLFPFVSWLNKNSVNGVVGEFGIPNDAKWIPALELFLEITDSSCIGWFLWAGGAWSKGYELSLEPIGIEDKLSIVLLRSYFKSKNIK